MIIISVYRSGEKRKLRAARGSGITATTLALRRRALHGQRPRILSEFRAARASAAHLTSLALPDVAWPTARSAALWAFCRRAIALTGDARRLKMRERIERAG